ncbi:MAG: hypothetical protein FWD67_12550 [Betaproteobacteria bacterium]|nr:hypothetical protein [Betaproteobacteria bacterium]
MRCNTRQKKFDVSIATKAFECLYDKPYDGKTTLKVEINKDAWSTLNSDTSRPFDKPKSGRIAVKVINHLGDEVMKVFRVR